MSSTRKNRRDLRRAERLRLPLLQTGFGEVRSGLRPVEFLPEEHIERIHQASLEILENVGIDFLDDEALSIWASAGAKVDFKRQHVWIDRSLLLAAIVSAPPSFTWRARNPEKNLFVGENSLIFGPNGGMVYSHDLDNGRRIGTMADYIKFIKLGQLAPQLHMAAWEQVSPQDIPSNVRHLHRMIAAITLSDKAMMEAAHGRIITADCLQMAQILFGSLEGEPVIGDVVNVNSPLRYDERMLGGLITYARAGQVTFITPFILAGAMSPVTIAAAVAQQNAEALAGVALTQLVRRGAPVIYGGFTTNIDLKSGSPAFGTPEGAWALLVGGQLARYYNLPYRGSGSLTTAKSLDSQAAYETMWNLWPAILAHTNLIMHAVGWLDGGLTASFEKFVIDLENLGMFRHFLAGFQVDEESLALDMIAEVGAGGHHLGTPHTQARYREAFYESSLANRQGYDGWLQGGKVETAVRANAIWKEMLKQYEQPPLAQDTLKALEDFVARRERDLEGVHLYE